MPRKKKSRKVGQIGVPSVSKDQRKRKPAAPNRPTVGKGNKSGSRHSAPAQHTEQQQKVNKDPRIGSKKPIPLIVEPVQDNSANMRGSKPKQTKYFSPAQELAALEADDKLNDLLDQLDDGVELSKEQQAYVDSNLARHRVLCDLLGINEEEESDDFAEDDPLARLNAIDINKFK